MSGHSSQIECHAIGAWRNAPYQNGTSVYFGYPSISARLLEFCSMDVVFVAVDFEGHPGSSSSSSPSQTGIAILDTRDLNKAPEDVVITRQLCTGPSWYCDTVPTKLLFGVSEGFGTLEDMSKRLTELLCFTDPSTNTLRPIVVIGHTLEPNSDHGDISCLNRLTNPSIRSPIVDYLDTCMDREILRPVGYQLTVPKEKLLKDPSIYRYPSLRRILEYLDIPFANLHVAVHDAMFTLRAALVVAVREHQNKHHDLTSAEINILSKLQDIALVPLSLPPGVNLGQETWGHGNKSVFKAAKNTEYHRNFEIRKQQILAWKNRPQKEIEDWADGNDCFFPWDAENEETSSLLGDESLMDPDFDQRPSSPDDEPESDDGSGASLRRNVGLLWGELSC